MVFSLSAAGDTYSKGGATIANGAVIVTREGRIEAGEMEIRRGVEVGAGLHVEDR